MQGISCRITGHDHPLNVRFDNLGERDFDGHQGDVSKERQRLLFVGKCSCLQFPYHCLTRHEEVRVTVPIPPFPCPVSPGDHFRFWAHLVVEAWDGCLYVVTTNLFPPLKGVAFRYGLPHLLLILWLH